MTGDYGAGKDSVAEMLQKRNFYHFSLSDMLREELRRRKKEITRDNLINIGNELRENVGADVLAQRALKKVECGENFVFTSIRNPAEVKLLQKRNDFILIHVTASEKTRIARLKKRGKKGDPMTLNDMRAKQRQERSSNPKAQQMHTVAKMARIILKNETTLEALEKKVGKIVKDWMYKLQETRPGWDLYFLGIAEAVKMRCNCMSAKKGAIIVRDKQILSTGYNGSPKGLDHCNEGGCQRCTTRHMGEMKSGVYSEPCVCVHAEANAIIQAAYNGAPTKGATLYTTFTPCTECAKLIINAGIKRVIGRVIYPDDVGIRLLRQAKIPFKVIKND